MEATRLPPRTGELFLVVAGEAEDTDEDAVEEDEDDES
jgi:hypothetical protein